MRKVLFAPFILFKNPAHEMAPSTLRMDFPTSINLIRKIFLHNICVHDKSKSWPQYVSGTQDLLSVTSFMPVKPAPHGPHCHLSTIRRGRLAHLDHSCISFCVLTMRKHFPRMLLFSREPLQWHSQFRGSPFI